jgi:hypothetical protein
LIAICVADAAEAGAARQIVGPDHFVEAGGAPVAGICRELEERGLIRPLEDPLLGGAGI